MAELSDVFREWPKKEPEKPKVVIDIKDYALEAILSAVLGFYAAFVFWDVWSIGVKGLGFNATIFIYALTALLVVTRTKERPLATRDLTWIAPSLVIGLSFSLYENSFFEPLNCFIFPALLIWNFVTSSDHFWGRLLSTKQGLVDTFESVFSRVFDSIAPVWRAYIRFVTTSSRLTRSQARKITEGLGLLLVIFVVVLPLLYSSDNIFAFLVEHLGAWFGNLILENLSIFIKVPYAGLVTVLLLGICIRSEYQAVPVADPQPKALDSIISGIVLSGLLTVYLAFLFAQFQQLWDEAILIRPHQISSLADTGVGQLIVISIINVVGFHFLRRRTNRVIRILLPALAVASVLVLGPTIYKSYLYILWTGLNYEKFYMSYLILFFVALLVFLSAESFRKKQADIAKRSAIIFTVMYSAVAVFPVSQLAHAVNTELAKSEDASLWLKGGAWREELPVSVELFDTAVLLEPSLADVSKEIENLEDFKSLLKIMHRVDSREVEKTQWCIQFLASSGDPWIRVGYQCVVDSTHTEEHGKAWVVDAGDLDGWEAGAKSSFAWKFGMRSGELRHSEITKQDFLSATRDLKANLRAGLIERIHRDEHIYKWLSNSKYVGGLWQYCLTESKLISHISPEGCHQLRGVAFTMSGPKSDPVLAPNHIYLGNFFVVTRADLLTKLRPPSVPKVDEKNFATLWHQKSLEVFKIERALEVLRENQEEKWPWAPNRVLKKELLERFNKLEKKQKEAREKWRNEISEMGPKSVFMQVIE